MRAIAGGADNASDLGRRLSISKQAAAKVVALLEDRGYVARMDDAADSRRKLLTVTPLGHEVMQQGEAIFDALRDLVAHGRYGQQLAPGIRHVVHARDIAPIFQ